MRRDDGIKESGARCERERASLAALRKGSAVATTSEAEALGCASASLTSRRNSPGHG